MLVSPWLPVGLGSQVFPNQVFDHTSIISSLRETFSLVDPLTHRDAAAPTWSPAVLSTPRTVSPLSTRHRARPKMSRSAPDFTKVSMNQRGSGTLMGMAHIAVDIDWYVAERMRTAPLITSQFQVPVAAASQVLDHHVRGEPSIGSEPLSQPLVERGQRTLLEYLAAVQRRDLQYVREQAHGRRRRTS
jgi:phospholipase C